MLLEKLAKVIFSKKLFVVIQKDVLISVTISVPSFEDFFLGVPEYVSLPKFSSFSINDLSSSSIKNITLFRFDNPSLITVIVDVPLVSSV